MGMYAIDELAQLHDQVQHHRLWHWFVAGGHGVMEGWQLSPLRVAMASWLDDVAMTDALTAFAQRSERGIRAVASSALPTSSLSTAHHASQSAGDADGRQSQCHHAGTGPAPEPVAGAGTACADERATLWTLVGMGAVQRCVGGCCALGSPGQQRASVVGPAQGA
ncbi:hypothetical protein G6F24_015357 [Rhizopus arrhizus]|nr:hypothetical protein G6F24_015357 [Rhizopus arrhizus]